MAKEPTPEELQQERDRLAALPCNALTSPCSVCKGTGVQRVVADPEPPRCEAEGCCRGRVLRPFEDIPAITFGPLFTTEEQRRDWYNQTAVAMKEQSHG